MTGGGSSHEQQIAPQQTAQQQYQQSQQPCEIEWKRFLECSQSASDLSLCQAYNDLFKVSSSLLSLTPRFSANILSD